MNDIKYCLNNLWASKILECKLDFSRCKLDIVVEQINNEMSTRHDISISGIDMFCFYDDLQSAKRGIPIFMELTAIDNCRDKTLVIIEYPNADDVEDCCHRPNLILEISDAVILISAEQIKIDQERFNLR